MDLDGWTSNTPSEVTWAASGGNPGGYARHEDSSSEGTFLWAPAKFLGDWSSLDGTGSLSFDHKLFTSGAGVRTIAPYTVLLSGPAGAAEWTSPGPSGTPPFDTPWLSFTANLVESEWTITQGSWTALLADVTQLEIIIEIIDSTGPGPPWDISGLDNIVLTGEPSLSHFMFYKVSPTKNTPKFVKFGPVLLTDQFQLAGTFYNVIKPQQLGLPANKNAEGVADKVTHLEEYKIKPDAGTAKFEKVTDVRVENQCNDLFVEVVKPTSLLVPTNKDLSNPVAAPDPASHNVDHFLCYKVKGQKKLADGAKLPGLPKGIQVEVEDQFQARRYDLKKITKLCNPVDKSGDPVLLSGPNKGDPFPITPASRRNPGTHLVCYKAKLAKKFIQQNGCGSADPADKGTKIDPEQAKHEKRIGIFVNNQFGPGQLDTKKEVEFCIPSEKLPPPSLLWRVAAPG